MRASCRAPLILVPGAWQTSQLESPLAECLIDSDYDVKVPALPSPDTVPAVPVSSNDVSAVRTEFMAEKNKGQRCGRDHAFLWSGYRLRGVEGDQIQATFEIQQSFTVSAGGVVRLIFIAGIVLPVGVNLWSKMDKGWRKHLREVDLTTWETTSQITMCGAS